MTYRPRYNAGQYNETDTCEICKTDFHGKAFRKYNNEENWTGEWVCKSCHYRKYTYGSYTYVKPAKKNLCDACGIIFDNAGGNPCREYNKDGIWTGKRICNMCYKNFKDYGTYTKPEKKKKIYNENDLCNICGLDFKTIPGHPYREFDKNGVYSEFWICSRCNSKSEYKGRYLCNRRIENQDPSSEQAKGDMGEELLCRWKGFTNLNKKYDNYNVRIDCIDEKTGLFYQAKISYHNIKNDRWNQGFKNIQNSIKEGYRFASLFLFCISNDGKIVETIYDILEKEIISRSGIGIYKHYKAGNIYHDCWHERYKFTDEEELKKVNKIWEQILKDKEIN